MRDSTKTTLEGVPPNAYRKIALIASSAHIQSASSLHPGGVHVLMGDGAVRFVKDSIQTWPYETLSGRPSGIMNNPGGWWDRVPAPGVWQALSSRSGAEIVSGDAF